MPIIVAVEGNIGAGKTTILHELEKKGYTVFYENLESWEPLLLLFYQDPARWSFTIQVAILQDLHLNWAKAQSLPEKEIVFFERSPKSSKIFTFISHARHYLSDLELKTYNILYECLGWEAALTVMIDTSVPSCLDRINQRNRNGEESINAQYLSDIESRHNDMITTHM